MKERGEIELGRFGYAVAPELVDDVLSGIADAHGVGCGKLRCGLVLRPNAERGITVSLSYAWGAQADAVRMAEVLVAHWAEVTVALDAMHALKE